MQHEQLKDFQNTTIISNKSFGIQLSAIFFIIFLTWIILLLWIWFNKIKWFFLQPIFLDTIFKFREIFFLLSDAPRPKFKLL